MKLKEKLSENDFIQYKHVYYIYLSETKYTKGRRQDVFHNGRALFSQWKHIIFASIERINSRQHELDDRFFRYSYG